MEKKYKRLVIVGLVVFIALTALFYFMISSIPAPDGPRETSKVYYPRFVVEFRKENSQPGGSGVQDILAADLQNNTIEVQISEQGFPFDSLVLERDPERVATIARLNILNQGSDIRAIVVVSKKMDGSDYAIDRFSIAPGKGVEVNLVGGSYLDEIIASESVFVERVELGIPLFEISCLKEGEDESSYFTVYG